MFNTDPRFDAIAKISSKAGFTEWVAGLLGDIQEAPDSYGRDAGALRFIHEIMRFSKFESEGLFANHDIPEPAAPESWRLLAYAVYFCTPGPD
jgi:hypothetical protein